MNGKQVIAVDLGASGGRVMRVSLDGERFALEEIHRFPNIPVETCGTLHWDALRLWHEIQTGIAQAGAQVASIGVDTWGVDFALLDRAGGLLANPVHYRDSRTDGMTDWVFDRVPRRVVFERTGNQVMQINTLYQLASLAASGSPLLEAAHTFLPIPNLITYWLTGERVAEFTHATTTQCYSPHTRDWDRETLTALNLPDRIFPKIVPPGTQIGTYNTIPVILPGCHDTASAVAAVPATTPNYAYLSSGTWSLIGLEVAQPLINDAAYTANMTNEGGVYGTYRLLKNVMGLWLEQECRATWQAQGVALDYAAMIAQAQAAAPFQALLDPDTPAFLPPGEMPGRIRAYCRETGQPEPETIGQMLRCIYESLALKYRQTIDTLAAMTGAPVEQIHVIGGGSQNALLCQMTADATGRPVIAGPVEATALGNAIVQFITLREIDDLRQARELLCRTLETQRYEPADTARWDAPYARFCELIA